MRNKLITLAVGILVASALTLPAAAGPGKGQGKGPQKKAAIPSACLQAAVEKRRRSTQGAGMPTRSSTPTRRRRGRRSESDRRRPTTQKQAFRQSSAKLTRRGTRRSTGSTRPSTRAEGHRQGLRRSHAGLAAPRKGGSAGAFRGDAPALVCAPRAVGSDLDRLAAEGPDPALEALLEVDLGLPVEELARAGDVGPAHHRIVDRAAPRTRSRSIEPVTRMHVCASSSIVSSWSGLPRLTGRCSPESASRYSPRIRSST